MYWFPTRLLLGRSLRSELINFCWAVLEQTPWKGLLIVLPRDGLPPRQRAHEKFVPVYNQIKAASDYSAVLALLARMPLTGPAN
jgi:hypothetical protein